VLQSFQTRALLLALTLVIAFVVGVLAGLLARTTGVRTGDAVLVGGASFAGTATLAVTLLQFLAG
jgi:predicted branched-subunit amino acid permease